MAEDTLIADPVPATEAAAPPTVGEQSVAYVTSATSGVKGSHTHGPLCSGVPGKVQVGEALLLRRFTLGPADVTGFAVSFPPGAIVLQVIVQTSVAFNGTTPLIKLGTTSGGAELASITPPAAGATLATAITASPVMTTDTNLYLTMTGASTLGAAHLMITYAGRPALKWI
jgi:hypothetical protein